MEKVKEFFVEPSKANKSEMVLIAVTESGKKYVVSGDHWNPSVLQPYERAFHVHDPKDAMI